MREDTVCNALCSLKEAIEMHTELQTEYGYNINQLVEVAGLSCAFAVVKVCELGIRLTQYDR